MRSVVVMIAVSALLLLSGCATMPKSPLIYQTGAVMETLSASASFSISKGGQGMGNSGYLLYQRPDRLRLVILTPFGTPMMEAVITGDQITIINTSNGVAFSGRMEDLPRKGEGETWRQARWVMEIDPPGSYIKDGSVNRVNSTGTEELVTFADGLVVSKSLANGDSVRYGDYELVNGVPLATEIIMNSHDGGRFRIKLTDPEVNVKLSANAFLPRLNDLKIYPLSALQAQ